MNYLIALIIGISLTSYLIFLSAGNNLNTNTIDQTIDASIIESKFSEIQNVYNQAFSYGAYMSADEWQEIYLSFDKIPQFEGGELNFYSVDNKYFCVFYENKTNNNSLMALSEKRDNIRVSNNCDSIHEYDNNISGISISMEVDI